jgi:hypothetical protein
MPESAPYLLYLSLFQVVCLSRSSTLGLTAGKSSVLLSSPFLLRIYHYGFCFLISCCQCACAVFLVFGAHRPNVFRVVASVIFFNS